jgi:hypothetical protein
MMIMGAGLSAALVLGRARRRVVVIDSGAPRNAPAAHMQWFLSRDGMAPAELVAEGRREVTGYGVELPAVILEAESPRFLPRLRVWLGPRCQPASRVPRQGTFRRLRHPRS